MSKRTKLPPSPHRPTWAQSLNDREARFVREYASSLNAGDAALAAGYGKGNLKSAAEIASRLRRRPDVGEAIAQYIHDHVGATKARILEEIAKIAFADFTDFATLQEDGSLIVHPHVTLSEDQRAAIQSLEEHVTESGYRTLKLRLHDKGAALALLTRVTGMHVSKHEVSTTVTGQVEHVHTIADRVKARLDELAARQAVALPAPPHVIDVTPTASALVDAVPVEARS